MQNKTYLSTARALQPPQSLLTLPTQTAPYIHTFPHLYRLEIGAKKPANIIERLALILRVYYTRMCVRALVGRRIYARE